MPNRTVRSHRTGLDSLHVYMHAPSKASDTKYFIYKLNILTLMDLSGPTAKRARVGLGGSTLPAPRASTLPETPFPPPEPAVC